MRRYGRRRWLDLIAVMIATDGLIRLFSNRHRLLLPIGVLASPCWMEFRRFAA